MIRVILVDDEPQSSKALDIKLRELADDIEVVGIFTHPDKAVSAIKKIKPDLVFLDIEMPGMNGFQLLEKLEQFDFEVIFVTAYNEYMLNALHVSALDYLLKPVEAEELSNTFNEKKEQIELLSETLRDQNTPKRLAVATLQGVTFLKIKEIVRVEALSNYSTFHLVNKQKIMVSKTLKDFESLLTQQNFFRVNRSCIVNTDYIIKYKNEDGGVLELHDGTEIGVGPHRKNELLDLLSRI